MLSGGQWDLPSMPPFLVPARHTHMLFVLTPAERACRACCTWQHATAMALRQPQMRKRWDVRGRGQPLSTACGASGLQRSALLATSTSLCEVVTNLNTHTSAFRKREANLS
jgi:hypothetical protein